MIGGGWYRTTNAPPGVNGGLMTRTLVRQAYVLCRAAEWSIA